MLYKQSFVCLVFIGLINLTLGFMNVPSCGKTQLRKSRVKNGNEASEGEFPWMVSIRFGTGFDSNHICGGVLVHKKFVLTAAHCVHKKVLKYINVMIGEHDSRVKSRHESIVTVKKVHVHREFKKRYINDIALIELNRAVRWSDYSQPICLPPKNSEPGNSLINKMVIAGWGYTDEQANGGVKSHTLKKASIPMVPLTKCQRWYDDIVNSYENKPERIKLIDRVHMCAGYTAGHTDACQGDSGGPLMQVDHKRRWSVVGIVSSGIGCGRAKTPGIYTKVSSFIPWINKIINQA